MAGKNVLRISVEPTLSGPLAQGAAGPMIDRWEKQTADELAKRGVRELAAWPMNKTGRATGAFGEHLQIVHDGTFVKIPAPMIKGVTWGPWLEGTSKRNSSAHFGGYHLFAQEGEDLQKDAVEVGEQVLSKLISEIGGHGGLPSADPAGRLS